LNNLGNFFITQKKYNEALGAYLESMTLAKNANNALLATRALTNAAITFRYNEKYKESKEYLDRAMDETRKLDPSNDKAYGLINIGLTYRHLRPYLPEYSDLRFLSSQAFMDAVTVAETIGDLPVPLLRLRLSGNTFGR